MLTRVFGAFHGSWSSLLPSGFCMLLIAKARMEKWSTCARFPCDPKEGDVKPEEVTKASFSKLDAAGFEEKSGPVRQHLLRSSQTSHNHFLSDLSFIESVRVWCLLTLQTPGKICRSKRQKAGEMVWIWPILFGGSFKSGDPQGQWVSILKGGLIILGFFFDQV